jgi:ribonuclease HI
LLRIVFHFVSGHAKKKKGNKRADKLAATATISNGRAINNADILHAEMVENLLENGE